MIYVTEPYLHSLEQRLYEAERDARLYRRFVQRWRAWWQLWNWRIACAVVHAVALAAAVATWSIVH